MADKLKCALCNTEKTLNNANWYRSTKPEFEKYGNFANICKSCLRGMVFDKDNNVNLDGFMDVLKLLNKPFIKSLYIKELVSGLDLGCYLKALNFGKYRSMTFADSDTEDNEENTQSKNQSIVNSVETDEEITPEVIRFWGKGKGYEKEDYIFLQETFAEWTTRYKCDTLAEEKTYKFLSLKELEIQKARERGDNVDKLEETFRKLMSDANVTPRDANAASDPENMNALGLWIKDIEKYRPAEYFEDKKLYFDFFGIKDYLDRFIFRPLKNLLTGSRDFDKEFNVESLEEDSDEYANEENGDQNE